MYNKTQPFSKTSLPSNPCRLSLSRPSSLCTETIMTQSLISIPPPNYQPSPNSTSQRSQSCACVPPNFLAQNAPKYALSASTVALPSSSATTTPT